jgi:hypothetical protein
MNNDIKDRSLEFWIEVVKYYLTLKEKNIMKLLLNYLEAEQVLEQTLLKLKIVHLQKIL